VIIAKRSVLAADIEANLGVQSLVRFLYSWQTVQIGAAQVDVIP
jgi:hypothetical protein